MPTGRGRRTPRASPIRRWPMARPMATPCSAWPAPVATPWPGTTPATMSASPPITTGGVMSALRLRAPSQTHPHERPPSSLTTRPKVVRSTTRRRPGAAITQSAAGKRPFARASGRAQRAAARRVRARVHARMGRTYTRAPDPADGQRASSFAVTGPTLRASSMGVVVIADMCRCRSAPSPCSVARTSRSCCGRW